jgi:uncharacterized protein YjbJ (UPF0337 family)
MNDDTLKGMWKQVKGKAKAAFGKLTDDDMMEIEGNAEAGVGRLQERYGYTREQAETEWNKFRRENNF